MNRSVGRVSRQEAITYFAYLLYNSASIPYACSIGSRSKYADSSAHDASHYCMRRTLLYDLSHRITILCHMTILYHEGLCVEHLHVDTRIQMNEDRRNRRAAKS